MIQSTRNGLLISLLLLLIVNQSSAFNLDVVNYIRHEGQNGSMFGFSVALHQEAQRSWVIVGAPKADTSQYQQGVVQGGAVYRCDISDDNRCQVIHFDSNGNNFNERNEQIDTKSGQWFGATVASAGIDGPLVACAPRYVYHQHQPKKVERIEPVGTCFIAKDNFNTYQEFSPCRTMYWGYHRQGSCQAGLSAALNKNGDRLFVGAPGSWYWQGQVYSINTDAVFPYKPPRYGQFGDGGQMYSYGLNNPKDKVYSTKESSSKEDDSYLGYSSVTGDFTGDGIQGVAVGMPRGGGLLGKVLVFSWNLTNHANITGEQIGAYFGYSLCSIDVDGDKLEDLIIGAPMYTEPNNEGKYENGRVYIAYQNKFNKFKEVETREGIMSKGRFGLALSALGDINLDGYGDFAVGAPYDGVDGRGAVYIYHGSSAGPLAKPSQVIYAEDVIGTDHLSTFGFSLSGGIDLDGNQYPDLVVGAYNSNRALVFKSRAVAVMEASSVFEADNKMISLDNKNCTTLKDNKEVTCTIMRSCLKYNGVNLPATIDIEISWVLDSKKQRTPRMFFLNDEGKNIRNQTMRLNRGKSACTTETVYIADGIRDKLTPLEVEMKYNMRTASSSYTTSTVSRRRRAALEPVLDQNKGTVQRDSINIMKNCGSDNICIPDLRLEVKTVDEYLLGSKEPLAIDVLISNFGEDAFEAGFFMNIPSGLDFKRAERIGDIKDTPFTCTPPSIYTNNTLKCDIGNPFPARKVVNFRVTLDPSRKGGISPNYVFYMESNSTNVEAEGTSDDNRIAKDIGINVETDLSISGNSLPEDFHYNVSNYKAYENATHEADLGPQVVHIYDIRNNGTSSIDEIEVFINWPVETLDGEPLMYLLNQPETMGNVQCDPAQFVNEFRLQTDRSLEQKSYLDKNRVPVRNDFVSWSSSQRRQYKKKGTGAAGGGAGGAGGSISYDENRKNLDFEDNLESTGDSSYSHREQQGSYYQNNNNGGAAGGAGNRNTVNSQTSYTETHHGAANSGEEKMNKNWKQGSSSNFNQGSNTNTNFNQGSNSNTNFNQGSNTNTNFNQGSNSNSNSNFNQGSSFNTNQNSNQGSTFNNNQNFNQGSTTGGIRKWVAGSTGETEEEYYKRTQGFDSSNSEDSAFRVGGANAGNTNGNNREWSYEEKWNSSSINGGPVVTHVSSKNSSSHRGEDGKVRVSETSTEQVVLAGRFAGNWDESQDSTRNRQQSGSQTNFNSERNGGGYRQENSYRGSQTGTQTGTQTTNFRNEAERRVYEQEQSRRMEQEAHETERRRIEAEIETRRIQVEQRQMELERRDQEIERRRVEAERRSQTQTQTTYSESETRRRQQQESGNRSYGENERTQGESGNTRGSTFSETSRRQQETERRNNQANSNTQTGSINRQQNQNGFNQGSSNGGYRTEVTVEENVNQDISGLAARTQEQDHTGRRRMMSQQDGEAARPDLVTGVTTLEKAAQGGRGFQTSSFDLGVLNRGNADEDLRRHGHSSSTRVNGGNLAGGATGGSSSVNTGSSFNSRTSGSSSTGNSGGSLSGNSGSSSSGSSSYSNGGGGSSSSSNFETHSSGSRTGGSNSGTAGRQYTYSSTNQNDGSNGGFYTDDGEYEDQYEDYEQNSQSNSQRSGGNPTGYQSSSANYVHSSRTGSGLNAGHESVNQKFMLYPTKRTTRDIKNLDLGSDTLCKATKCVNVRCVVGPLDKNGGALIALRTRLVAHTLNKISSENEVKLSTMAVGRITKLPYIGASPNQPIKSHEVFVTAIPDPVPKSDSVPLWIVVLAACAGALILLLLVYLLYKCGFFKRNRPSGSTQERQPLNRNGNYHGDEHL